MSLTRREAIKILAGAVPALKLAEALDAEGAQPAATPSNTPNAAAPAGPAGGLEAHRRAGRLFYDAQELLKRPRLPGQVEPTQLYFHFRPARPADIVVTRDPETGDLDFTPQTFGPLTDNPLTICLHTNRGASPHSTRNLARLGAECVVALPGADLVRQTWITCVPMPRGVCEGEAAGLTLLPSKIVGVPGIAACPVNLECRVEFFRQQYSHNAVFLKVVGASVDEEMLKMDRLEMIRRGPTYEVDDATNKWGGAIERLGTNHELLECPGFPVGAKSGPEAGVAAWLRDLREAGRLSEAESRKVQGWLTELEKGGAAVQTAGENRAALGSQLTRALELAAWEDWGALHAHLA